MQLSEFKKALVSLSQLSFNLPDGSAVPSHFHITEVGAITKNFIDCGGTIREEKVINFQLWFDDNDMNHRLTPQKLLSIIELAEEKLNLADAPIEVEYQSNTIGKYGLNLDNNTLTLTNKMTDCLAMDKCGIPTKKPKINLADLTISSNSCPPGSGCC